RHLRRRRRADPQPLLTGGGTMRALAPVAVLLAVDLLPALDIEIVALPMKSGGGSGAPLRIVALVPGGAR
ncbi:MAG TPA: hypothetical protein VFY49_12400, partial [Myxococcota bacterium]|nr:hypothetical protein [Myxococcota bacterium]